MTKNLAKSNTVAGAVEQFAATSKKLSPAENLQGRSLDLFDMITGSRETTTWSQNDLFLATQLAKLYKHMETAQMELEVQGFTLSSLKGTPVPNPLIATLLSLSQNIQAMNRTLGLSASQRGMTGEDQTRRNKSSREIKDLNAEVDGNDLLA